MKTKIFQKLMTLFLVIFSVSPFFSYAQNIGVLDSWIGTSSPYSAITQRIFGKSIKITGLTTGLCLTLDANNILTTTACGGGGSLSGGTAGMLSSWVNSTTLTATGTPTATAYFATSTTATSTFLGGFNAAGTSGLTVLQNGNVGVGTISPSYPLEVNGIIKSAFTIYGATFTDWNNTNYFVDPGNSGTSMAVAGNVGIGTTTPASLLNISSSITGGSPNFQEMLRVAREGATPRTLRLLNFDGNTSTFKLQGAGTDSVTWTDMMAFQPITGYVGVGSTSPFAKLSLTANSLGSNPIFMVSTSTASATTTAFLIDSTGKLGVGTTSPSRQLSVTGTAYITDGMIVGKGVAGGTNASEFYSSPVWLSFASMTNGVTGLMTNATNYAVHTTNSTNGGYRILGADKANFAPGLNLIGVQGSTATGQQPGVRISGVRGATGSTSGRPMDFAEKVLDVVNYDSSRPSLMTILGNGNTGFGTSTPWGIVSIMASSTYTGPLMAISTSTGGTATTTAFIINSNGQVGIGTSTPWRTLSVQGSVAFSNLTGSATGNALCITTGKEIVDAGGATCVPSTIRVKENIKTLTVDKAKDIINQLKVVSFDYKKGNYQPEDSPHSYGLIGEEVLKKYPELVDLKYDKTVAGIFWDKINGLMLKNLQSNNENIESLKEENIELRKEIKEIKARLDLLENN